MLEGFVDLLNSYLSNEAVLRRVLLGLSAATLFVLGLGIAFLVMSATDPVRRRMGIKGERPPAGDRLIMQISTALGPVSEYVLPQKDAEIAKIRKQLVQAGFRSDDALPIFYTIKLLLIVVLPLVTLLASRWMPEAETRSIFTYAAVAAGIGLLLPNIVLNRLVERRIRALRNAFPDALDLLVVCVEAGLGLSASIQRVADELGVSHPELAYELSTVNAEIRAGLPREKALQNLSDRTGLPDIKGLVGLLVQSMRFGTSVSDALRVYSDEFRDKRMQRAEEIAAKMGTKLIFPLVVCMFPIFFIIAIGPVVIQAIDWFATLK